MGNESPHHRQPFVATPTPPPNSRPLGNRPLSRPVTPPTSRPIVPGVAPHQRKPRWGRRIAIIGICLLIVLVAVGMVIESNELSRLWSSSIVMKNSMALAQSYEQK